MKKRFFSLIMAMLMVLPMFPIHAHAWSAEVEDGVTCLYCGYYNFLTFQQNESRTHLSVNPVFLFGCFFTAPFLVISF
ncbi:MAG: hypothetical protein IJR70_05080 [Eubacterium sp.]|nr:hypothetical protein [Eubacterium sp.]